MLSAILPAYEELIEKKIVVDSTITDAVTMTINTQQKMTKAEAIRYYEDTFLINGFAILPVDDRTVKFVSVAQNPVEGTGAVRIFREPDPIPDVDDTIGYIMKFNNVSAEEASRTFQLFTRSTTGGYIPAPDGATMIITESARVIAQLIDLKQAIDVPRGNLRQEAIQLLRADAEEVSSALNEILTAATSQRQRSGGGTGRTNTPIATSAAARQVAANANANASQQVAAAAQGEIGALPDANNVHIHPITRTNSVLVIARPVDFAYVKGLVEIFDAPNEVDNFLKRELRYLPVLDFLGLAENALYRYQDGANAQLSGGTSRSTTSRNTGLTANNRNSTQNRSSFGNSRTSGGSSFGGGSSLGGGGGISGSGGDLGGPESVLVDNTLLIADSQLNNIIVSGPPEHLRIIDQLLDEVDVRPRQVYISAVIAQVALGDEVRFGMDLLRTVDDITIGGENVDIAGLYRTTTGGGTILDPNTLQTVEDFVQQPDGLSIWAQIGTFLNTYVEALENTGKFTVISRPFVFTGNNQVASINSGEEVAVPTSTTSSLNSSDTINSSIGYREVLLELEVLPLINSADEVTLEISQRNQNISGFTQISGNQVPNLQVQALNTKVRLPNRGIVVLGGIIQEEDRDNVNGLPFLSKVPVIKRLTGSTNIQKQRRELLIFLQPHIIEGSNDLIDANIEKVSPTFIGEEALEQGKPEPEVSPDLFPEFKKPRRFFPRRTTEDPLVPESSDYIYEEPALPQHGPQHQPAARVEPTEVEKPRRRLFNFKGREEKEPAAPAKEKKRGLFNWR